MGRSRGFWQRLATLGTIGTVLAGAAWAGPPPCTVADRPAQVWPVSDGRWTVLDTVFRLPAGWRPPDLIPAREAGFADDRLVRAVIVPDLRALRERAAAAGHELALYSAFRSHDYQRRTFAYWVEREGRDAALRTSARAGHSEHQLGTAVDLGNAGGPAPWDSEDWGRSPAGAWLAANGWRFGFVMSYPRNARAASCYAYEPWHWRWVGRDLARRIHAGDRVPRQVLWEVVHEE